LSAATPILDRRAFLSGVAVLAFCGAFGFARLWAPEPEPQPVGLLIVQGNIAQEVKWREESRVPILRRYVETTRDAAVAALRELPPGHRLAVIWPETAVPFLLPNDPEARQLVAGALPQNALLLTGTARGDFTPAGYARDLFNSLVVISPTTQVLATADKMKLVPFGEFMPFRGLLPIRLVQSTRDYSASEERRLVVAGWLPPLVGLICYEVIFTGRIMPSRRPAWIVNVTNDAWFGITAGPWQHFAAARLRAVEEGLPLARAAQTGISAVFDARGRLVTRGPLGESAVILALLPSPRAPTIYADLGLMMPLGLALAIFAFGWILSARSQR